MTSPIPKSAPTDSPNQNIIFTPWLNRGIASRERIQLVYDSGIVLLNVQNQSVFDRIAAFVANNGKNHFTEKTIRVFRNITPEQFEKEKESLANLQSKKSSLEGLIKKIEEDLKLDRNPPPPVPDDGKNKPEQGRSLTPQEVQERLDTIRELRAELEVLGRAIDSEHPVPGLDLLNESVAKVKLAVQEIFRKLNSLEEHLTDTDDATGKQFTELKSKAELKPLAQQIHDIRQTIVEELELERRADAFTASLSSLPDYIQDQWNEFITGWKNDSGNLKPNPEKAEERKKILEETMAQISALYAEEVADFLENERALFLQAVQDEDFEPNLGKLKTASYLRFKRAILAGRADSWDKLIAQSRAASSSIAAANRVKEQLAAMKAEDEVILQVTAVPSRGIISMLWTYPSEMLFGADDDPASVLEATDALYREKLTECLGTASPIVEDLLLRLHDKGDRKVLGKKLDAFRALFNVSTPDYSAIKSYLESLAKSVQEAAAGREDGTELKDKVVRINALIGATVLLTDSKKKNIVDFANETKQSYSDLFEEENHPQLADAAFRTYESLLQGGNDTPGTAGANNLKIFAIEQIERLKAIGSSSATYRHYSDVLADIESKAKILTGPDAVAGKNAIENMHYALQKFTLPGDEPINLSEKNNDYIIERFPGYYEDLLKRSEDIITAIIDREQLKLDLGKEIDDVIKEFHDSIDKRLSDLDLLEERLGTTFEEGRSQLAAAKESMSAKRNKGTFHPGLVAKAFDLFPWAEKRPEGEFDASSLSLKHLKDYLEQLKQTAVQEEWSIDNQVPVKELKEHVVAYDTKVEEAHARADNLKKDFNQRNPALRSEKNLQFKNASLLEKGIGAIDDEQETFMKELHKRPTGKTGSKASDNTGFSLIAFGRSVLGLTPPSDPLKAAIYRVDADTVAVENMITRSENMNDLTLLDQIAKLDDDPETQKQAKKALLESMEEKMNSHARLARSVMGKLETYKGVHYEAKKLVGDVWKKLETKAGSTPLRKHAAHKLNSSDPSTVSSQEPVEVNLDKITTKELTAYHRQIEETIEKSTQHLRHLESLHTKATKAESHYSKTLKLAQQKAFELDNADQMIEKSRLMKLVDESTGTKDTLTTEEDPNSLWSLLPKFGGLFGESQKNATSRALYEFTQVVGNLAGKIKAGIEAASRETIIPLRDQMNLVSSGTPEFKLVRDRILLRSEQMLSKTANSLAKYREDTHKLIGTFIPFDSSFSQSLESALDKGLEEVTKMKEEHVTGYHWFDSFKRATGLGSYIPLSSREKVSKLSRADHLIDYYDRAAQSTAMLHRIENKFALESLIKKHDEYTSTLTKGLNTAEFAKKTGSFYTAYLIESKLSYYDQMMKALWTNQVYSKEDAEKLANAFKGYKTLMDERLETVAKVAPKHKVSLENQLFRLSNFLKSHNEGKMDYFDALLNVGQEIAEELFTHETTVIESYMKETKGAVAKSVKKKSADYEDFLKGLMNSEDGKAGAIEKLGKAFNISKGLKDRALKAAERELGTFRSETFRFTTGNYSDILTPARDILFAGIDQGALLQTPGMQQVADWIHGGLSIDKTVDQMSYEDIIRLRPDENITKVITAGKERISQSFQFTDLSETYADYKKARKEAEKVRDARLNEKQFLHADRLETAFNNIDRILKEIKDGPEISQNDEARRLVDRLKNITQGLKDITNRELVAPPVPLAQQLRTLPADSPVLEKVRTGIVDSIHASADKEIDKAAAAKNKLEAMCDALKMPKAWKKNIVKGFTDVTDVLKTTVEPRQVNGTPVNIDQLPFNELMAVNDAVQARIRENEWVMQRLRIDPMKKQFDEFERLSKRAEKAREGLIKKRQIDSAELLANLSTNMTLRVRAFFSNAPNADPKVNVDTLIEFLGRHSMDYATQIQQILDRAPNSLGDLLLAEPVGTHRYKEIRGAIIEATAEKIRNQNALIDTYHKKLDEIRSNLRSFTKETVDLQWNLSSLINHKIDLWQQRLDGMLTGGLPIFVPDQDPRIPAGTPHQYIDDKVTHKKFGDLDTPEVVNYEEIVDNLTEPLEKDKNERDHAITKILEEDLGLTEINKELKHFIENIQSLERSSKTAKADRKSILEAAVDANKKLIQSVLGGMALPESSINARRLLKQANASLLRLRGQYANNKPMIEMDPWTELVRATNNVNDRNRDVNIRNAIGHVIVDGYATTYTDKERNEVHHLTPSIQKQIQDGIDEAVAFGRLIDEQRDELDRSGVPHDHPAYLRREECLAALRNAAASIDALRNQFTMSRPGGDEVLRPNQIRTLDELTAYQVLVLRETDKVKYAIAAFTDRNVAYWLRYAPPADDALPVVPPQPAGGQGAPPAPQPAGGQGAPPAPQPAGGPGAPPAPQPAGGPGAPPAPPPRAVVRVWEHAVPNPAPNIELNRPIPVQKNSIVQQIREMSGHLNRYPDILVDTLGRVAVNSPDYVVLDAGQVEVARILQQLDNLQVGFRMRRPSDGQEVNIDVTNIQNYPQLQAYWDKVQETLQALTAAVDRVNPVLRNLNP